MYYGSNVDAILYMGQSTADTLPAPGADTFLEVPLTGRIKPPRKEIRTGFFNVTNDSNRRSVGGTSADKTVEGNVVLDWDEATHQAMNSDADAQQKRNWRIIYPDGAGSRQLDFVGFVSVFDEQAFEAGEEAVEHRADFVITVDGAVTES